ncbi:MAG: 50S ribosomal protein L3 [Alphaproteobacteria bacterium]|nr:50S ribosomal protein L3 [Alphaproteobacteria bacterium]MDE6570847.1 50S ribosomal protein L3 [Alphaproteobacteria bacterium]
MKRSGLITTKIGMTRLYDDNGVAHGVTVLSVGDCAVIGNRSVEKHGYIANVLGMREAKAKHVAKPQMVAAQKAGVKPYRKVVEFRVSEDCIIPVGTQLSSGHFVAGQFVDVQATSKGKGFQGAMKRHNFGGKEATHGVLKAHRSIGGTGMREWPGRVLKGKKMAGQMGNETVSVQNLKVFGIDATENLIFVEGAVPGANGTFVLITDAVKKEQKDLPIPTMAAAQTTDAGTEQVTETETAAVAE